MLNRILYIVLFLIITNNCIAGNPMLHGTWKGFLISNTNDEDNRNGLPVTLTIVDDNDKGEIFGEMVVSYRYQTDVYRAKYKISGNIDYANYRISLQQGDFIFNDLLPKGLKWCTGGGTFGVYRSSTAKKIYMDGFMQTNCGSEKLRLILIKM